MTRFEFWNRIRKENAPVFKGFTPDELDDVAQIILYAIDEELNHPDWRSFWMTWCTRRAEIPEKVIDFLQKVGINFVEGEDFSHFEWRRFLTVEE